MPLYAVIVGLLLGGGAVAGLWYYFTPKYTRVGYQPIQPVSFSHATHAGKLAMDCRYCHTGVEKSWYAGLPSAKSCMNCHNQVLKDDPRLELVRTSSQTGEGIRWVQIHKLPDYVYFNHAVHVTRGVSCVSCHGEVQKMVETYHAQPMSMTFCLDCHRNPTPNLRPLDKVTDLAWDPQRNLPPGWFAEARRHGNINPSDQCSSCHR